MILRAIVGLLAAAALAAAPEGALFDGSSRARYELPALKAAAPVRETPTPDLLAAGLRWDNAVQAAKLAQNQPAAKAEFTFAVIGDAEPGRFFWERFYSPGKDVFERLLEESQAENPDFIFQLGDFVSKGTVEEYREHVELLDARVKTPFFAVIGNHDRSRPNGAADKTLYRAVRGKTDFYFDHQGWRFIGLDTSDRRLMAPQLAWLKETLSVPGRKVIFTHVPPAYLKGKLGSHEPEDFEGPPPEGYIHDFLTAYFEWGASEFEELVSAGGVERVYMGHIHAMGSAEHKGVTYVLSGCGGSPHYPLPPGYPKKKLAHYLSVKAGPHSLAETVRALDGGLEPRRLAPFPQASRE